MVVKQTAVVWRVMTYILLAFAMTLAITPVLWLIANTTKKPEDIFNYAFFSPRPTFQNYRDLFTQEPFVRYMINSVFIASASVCIQLFFSSLAGYGLAKYNFWGKKFVMGLMLATMMIPGQVTLAPSYELLYRMGLVNTYVGLLVPGAVSVFGIFLFRQSILQVPDELIHAARIDGCTEFGIYKNIVMPVTRPMIGAFCLIGFLGSWNSFLWPQILLHSKEKYTLPIALSAMQGLYGNQFGMLMAGTFLCILPVVVLFFALQKEFVSGLTAGAVKG